MSDAEWAVTEPTLPVPAWKQGRGGRPAEWCRRDIVDAIRYLVKEGIQWRAMPVDFPPYQTVYDLLDAWQESGAAEAMHGNLRAQCRIAARRSPEPTAAVIDSQSVKAAETVGRTSRGYDAGKKINGRKRHIAVDTIGLLLTVLITAAGVQDRDGARPLLWNLRKAFPSIRLTWADSGYAGQADHLGEDKAQAPAHPAGHQAHRAAQVHRAAPPLGGGAHLLLDHQVTAYSPRL
jgi:transposase